MRDRAQTFAQLSRIAKNNFAHSNEILSIASGLASIASDMDPKFAKRLLDYSSKLSQIGEDMTIEARKVQSYVSEAL